MTFFDFIQDLFSGDIVASQSEYSVNYDHSEESYSGGSTRQIMGPSIVEVKMTFMMPIEAFNDPLRFIGRGISEDLIAAVIKADKK